MIRVGLSGGIGAGKSTVARTLTALGAYLIDSDKIARDVVARGTAGLAELVETFGDDILADDGNLDRSALASKAFADDEQRRRLNAITHPRVGARTWELLEAAPNDAIVVQDVPLLVENHMAPFFHLVAIVHADEELRLHRLTQLRGMDADDARARIRSQATEEQRREVADVWLDNPGTHEQLADLATGLWNERLVPYEANVRAGTHRRLGSLPVVATDPTWEAQGKRLVARLRFLCGDVAVRVDHVGSTAVPGLASKDVIDLQVSVRDAADFDALAEPLAAGGFPRLGEIDGERPKPTEDVPTDSGRWRRRVHVAADPGRPANVHIRVDGEPNQRFALQFRDLLIADSSLRGEYLGVKTAAQAAEGNPRAYADAEEPWLDAIYPRVTRWAAETGWKPAG